MAKNVAILGPESTGKSSLAAALAAHFHTLWVPEYARDYLTHKGGKYSIKDVEHIAKEQFRRNEEASKTEKTIWFADTELLVCAIWCRVVFGTTPLSIKRLLENQHFDLYLLCSIDLAWQPDPLREHPHLRRELFELYEQELLKLGWHYVVVSGQGHKRTNLAIESVNFLLLDK